MVLLKSKKGMTLVEILASSLIIGICVASMIAAYASSMRHVSRAREMSIEADDLKDVFEKIRCTPFTDITTDFPDGEAVPESEVGVFLLPQENIVVNYPDGTAGNPLLIEVELTWYSETIGGQSVTCRTQRTDML